MQLSWAVRGVTGWRAPVLELGALLEQSEQTSDVVDVYAMIDTYNLPGKALAQARISEVNQGGNEKGL